MPYFTNWHSMHNNTFVGFILSKSKANWRQLSSIDTYIQLMQFVYETNLWKKRFAKSARVVSQAPSFYSTLNIWSNSDCFVLVGRLFHIYGQRKERKAPYYIQAVNYFRKQTVINVWLDSEHDSGISLVLHVFFFVKSLSWFLCVRTKILL